MKRNTTMKVAAAVLGAMLTLAACGGGGSDGGGGGDDDQAGTDDGARAGGVEMTAEQQAMLPTESGYVRLKVSVSATDGNPRPVIWQMFKRTFELCNQARALYEAPEQPLPLEDMELFMGYTREHMYDASVGAAREESYNRYLVQVKQLPKDAAPDCSTTFQVRDFRSTEIWGRDGHSYRVEYDQQGQPVKVKKSSKTAHPPRKVAVEDHFARLQYAGQTCVKPPYDAPAVGGSSLCNWEPFARVNFKNLPMHLELTMQVFDRHQAIAAEATTNRSAFGGGWGGKEVDALPEGVPVE